MTDPAPLSRRFFISAGLSAAGGLVLGVALPGRADALPIEATPWLSPEDAKAAEVNAWILIDPDDSVTIRVAQSEMGEGIFTALPMIVAEELECDWTKVRAEYAEAHRNLVDGHPY